MTRLLPRLHTQSIARKCEICEIFVQRRNETKNSQLRLAIQSAAYSRDINVGATSMTCHCGTGIYSLTGRIAVSKGHFLLKLRIRLAL